MSAPRAEPSPQPGDALHDCNVAVACGFTSYGGPPPYSPRVHYSEYAFRDVERADADDPSATAYAGVREALRLLGLDADRFGTAEWNPLGRVIRPGDRVVLKPNLVREFRETRAGDEDCLVTHGAVIRAVLDYVAIALQGRGSILIADAPHSDADFAALARLTGLREIQEFYRTRARIEIGVCDLRPEAAHKIGGLIAGHRKLPGDPAGYAIANLGAHSAFAAIEDRCHLLYGSEYDMGELYRHHRDGRHEYLISRSVLAADVVVSIPKLKTHKKVGLTVNLKNLVGINGNKNWLPHHREGTPAQGGDQYPDNGAMNRIERAAVTRFKRFFPRLGPLRRVLAGPAAIVGKRIFGDTNRGRIRSGNWYGNDTTWRMVVDLNRILLYADAEGNVRERPVRRFFSVVDGVIAGEGNGPLDPIPKPAGVILAGGNMVAVDLACAALMGFDRARLPVLTESFAAHALPLVAFGAADVACRSNDARFDRAALTIEPPALDFRPHFGWIGHVERAAPAAGARK